MLDVPLVADEDLPHVGLPAVRVAAPQHPWALARVGTADVRVQRDDPPVRVGAPRRPGTAGGGRRSASSNRSVCASAVPAIRVTESARPRALWMHSVRRPSWSVLEVRGMPDASYW
ncbi:hypothetical protein [Catenuloplanes indicus]|uniref:Uncharacterized protein n=1 Tax=Catenuloplanes indicus TaxID=137267 RepID=A0AAE3VU07_9ACTN|nr:hypothetical protein [Catenuloplanes indicus]MDQ0363786.1 hypothetical protein [Catenuloplanes indicus]